MAATDGLFAPIGAIQRQLSEMSGLQYRRPVPAAFLDKPGLEKFLNQRIRQAVKPSELRAEELTL